MAYDFNGTNQYLSATNPVSQVPVTLACWFYTRTDAGNLALVYVGDTATTQRFFLNTQGNTAGDPLRAQQVGSITQTRALSTAAFTTNTWSHACGVFSATNSTAVYLNGGNKFTRTVDVGTMTNAFNATNIGALAGASSYANALIAEVGIWNTALTDAEVVSLAKGVTCDRVRPQSLVFYAPLIRDLQDVRGGRAITNNNTATVANHTRVYQ